MNDADDDDKIFLEYVTLELVMQERVDRVRAEAMFGLAEKTKLYSQSNHHAEQ